ncbi:MAG TPA: MFS transporter [Actinomycetes bacterium]
MSRVLALRDARLYLAGQALSIFGDTALWLAAGIWVKSLTGSTTAAGLVFFAISLPQLLAPLAGLLVDRVRRRPLLIATNLATGTVVLALLAVHDRDQVWLVYLVMVLYGAAYTVLGSGQSALLTLLLPDELLAYGNGALLTIRQGLRLVAPVAGAGLFAWLGGGSVAVLDAATFLVAAATLARVRVAEQAPEPVRRRWRAELAAGARHVARTVVLRQMAIAVSVTVVVFGFSETLVFAVVDRGLQRPPSFLGLLLTVQGVAGLLGGLSAAPLIRRCGEGCLAGVGIALVAVASPLLALSSPVAVFAGVGLFGGSMPWIVVSASTLLQRRTPSHLQGRVFAALDTMVGAPQTLAIALGAVLVAVVDYRALLALLAVVAAGAGGWLLSRREQRPPPPERAAVPLPLERPERREEELVGAASR